MGYRFIFQLNQKHSHYLFLVWGRTFPVSPGLPQLCYEAQRHWQQWQQFCLKEVHFLHGSESEMSASVGVGLSEVHALFSMRSHAVQFDICLVRFPQPYDSSCLVEKHVNYMKNRHVM